MNKKSYENMLNQQQEEPKDSGKVAEFVNKKDVVRSKEFDDYERLCRGEETHVRICFSSTS